MVWRHAVLSITIVGLFQGARKCTIKIQGCVARERHDMTLCSVLKLGLSIHVQMRNAIACGFHD